jgi:FKBP-type peptidyl-prolyl cis-trans isomerase FkpA
MIKINFNKFLESLFLLLFVLLISTTCKNGKYDDYEDEKLDNVVNIKKCLVSSDWESYDQPDTMNIFFKDDGTFSYKYKAEEEGLKNRNGKWSISANGAGQFIGFNYKKNDLYPFFSFGNGNFILIDNNSFLFARRYIFTRKAIKFESILSKNEGFKKANVGLYYKFINHNETAVKVRQINDIIVKMNCVFKLKSNDSILVNSNFFKQSSNNTVQFILPYGNSDGLLIDGLKMMAKNDSATFLISAGLFYLKSLKYNEMPVFIKTGDYLQVDIKILDVQTSYEKEKNEIAMEIGEKPQIEKYIVDSKIKATPTASGLYYTETQKGKGALAKAGNEVTVNYTGKLLNGQVFDSSEGKPEPFKFILGQGMVIPGWEEALLLMAKGGKATLLIPSNLAYGARGAGGVIPPYSPLVFELELLDIKTNPNSP